MKEIESLKEYINSPAPEKTKDYLVFPLFQKIFGKKFSKEIQGSDIYIEGRHLVELKSDTLDFLPGFYQALHYDKKGLSFSSISVITYKFIGLWKLKELSEHASEALEIAKKSDPLKAPNEIGRINANKTSKSLKQKIIQCAFFKLTPSDLEGIFEKETDIRLLEFEQVLRNLEIDRIQIAPHNFIGKIEILKNFFNTPMEAIHCFYDIIAYWNATSKVLDCDDGRSVQVVDYTTSRSSILIKVKHGMKSEFKKFVESHYVFTKEEDGFTVDYYFSRFDEVISEIQPEYATQHGIFFTDHNLSKFALWFVRTYYEKKLSEKYIVLDPAGGSGNLVTSWKGHLKHKIVSELQPDLLRTIERRMSLDKEEVTAGFTIIPRTAEKTGLNFLDKSAEEYVHILLENLDQKGMKLDKPIAFLLNPPYKNTDENEEIRDRTDSSYRIHDSIIELTGNDAAKERYLAFLAQILNISKLQMGQLEREVLDFNSFSVPQALDEKIKDTPLLLIFTPTSWLIPRPSYSNFRKEFDKYFKYETGFIFLGNEFFKIKGTFPIAFTIWKYNYKTTGNSNIVKIEDLTNLKNADLKKNWLASWGDLDRDLKRLISSTKKIRMDDSRGDIRSHLPLIMNSYEELVQQPMYDFKRDPTSAELNSKKIFGGLPFKDERRSNKKTYGVHDSNYIGFMDDITPVRVKPDKFCRFSNSPDRVWFRLDSVFKDINKTKILSGPSDNRSYCAYDLASANTTFIWFAISKAFNGKAPIWVNQLDIWYPNISVRDLPYFSSLCYAFGLGENRCVVTKFEANNPDKGAKELFIDNPMSPNNPDSFWSKTLGAQINKEYYPSNELVQNINELYEFFNKNYTKGGIIEDIGLKNESYFKYFDYPDFLTQNSGLIQIKRFADINNEFELIRRLDTITAQTKDVREKIYELLVNNYKYFE